MSGTSYEIRFLEALFTTVLMEAVVLFLIVRIGLKIPKLRLSNGLLVFAGVFCSSTTLPYLWFVLPRFLSPYAVLVIGGELLVLIAEAVFYYFVLRIGVKRSLLVSFVCNLASVLGGLWMT